MLTPRPRLANLDLIRAFAIVLVVWYHITFAPPRDVGPVAALASIGEYGVDLFFALSGFLIGSLYWKELNTHGNVHRLRFVARRGFRTVPPYFVALICSYLAVWVARSEPFDPVYLVFGQNYYGRMPFFVISWTLCVQEHFYLALPFLLGPLYFLPKYCAPYVLILLATVPMVLRLAYGNPVPHEFGYYYTATHLRCDGLLLGVVMAYFYVNRFESVARLLRVKYLIYTAAVACLLSTAWLTPEMMYGVGYTMLAIAFPVAVLTAAVDGTYRMSQGRIISSVGTASYSIYLTHALVIHAVSLSTNTLGIPGRVVQRTLMLIAILIVGFVYYRTIERPSLAIMDRLLARKVFIPVPAREHDTSADVPHSTALIPEVAES